MIKLNYTKLFIGGHLDGLTYPETMTFTDLAAAQDFVNRGIVKGYGGQDYSIAWPELVECVDATLFAGQVAIMMSDETVVLVPVSRFKN